MSSWYIDRTRNLSSVFGDPWYQNLCDFALDDTKIDSYKGKVTNLISDFGINGKNPNAILTQLRDIGFIDDSNNATDFFKCCLRAGLSKEEILLLILLKRDDEKNSKSFIKPFVVIAKAVVLMKKNHFQPKINWNQCVNHLMKVSSYDEIDDTFVSNMVADTGSNPAYGPDIWFNALLATGLFTGTQKEIQATDASIPFLSFVAEYGSLMKPNNDRDEYMDHVKDSAYGLYGLFSVVPFAFVEMLGTYGKLYDYISQVRKLLSGKHRAPRKPNTHLPLNFILYGAPGTGKTYSTAQYAVSIAKDSPSLVSSTRASLMKDYRAFVDCGRICFTTFHQSYGYEDFIQGLRPKCGSSSLSFDYVDGIFKRIANRAESDPDNNYVLIIDEINRANISKVLGELITLLEKDKRKGEVNEIVATLPSGESFSVPRNLYLIGTMNTADKSISLIDAAIRRRFDFIHVPVDYSSGLTAKQKDLLEKLNKQLYEKLDHNVDLLVGHAYFIGKTDDEIPEVFNNAVIPLLYEYFFDKPKDVKDALTNVIDPSEFEIKDDGLSRIHIVKKGTTSGSV